MMFRSPLLSLLRSPHDDDGSPPRDALDGLLREWHDRHRATASANRDRLLDAVREDARLRPSFVPRWVRPLSIAASIGLIVVLGLLFTTATARRALADGIVMRPEAGRLDALAPDPVAAARSALGLGRSAFYKLLGQARERLTGLLEHPAMNRGTP